MRKILFESIGNIIMVSLFGAVIIEIFSTNAIYSDHGFQFTTGNISMVFFIYLIIFLVSRWALSKKDKSYSLKDGEFSTADEREKSNSYFASMVSYKATIFSLFVALGSFLFINSLLNPPFHAEIDLFTSGIILFALVICIGFLSYAMAWVFKDTR